MGITRQFDDQMRAVDLGGGDDAVYHYDAAGQRVRKVVRTGSTTKERLYLGAWERFQRSTTTLQEERDTLHVMDDRRRIVMIETLTVDGGSTVTTPIPRQRFQLGNHLDSAALEVDEDGALITYEEYHPFGTTSWWASNGSTDVSARRYRYTGKEKDEETGLAYHGARYYAAWLGRWERVDPIGLKGGINRFEYCKGRPTSLHDPNGQAPVAGSSDPLSEPPRLVPLRADVVDVQGLASMLSSRGLLLGPLGDALQDRPAMEHIPGTGGSTPVHTSVLSPTLSPSLTGPITIGTSMPTASGALRPATTAELAEHAVHELVHYYTAQHQGAHSSAPAGFSTAAAPELARQLATPRLNPGSEWAVRRLLTEDMTVTEIVREEAGYAASNFMRAQVEALQKVEAAIEFERANPIDDPSRLVSRLNSIQAGFHAMTIQPFDASVYGGLPGTNIDPAIAAFVQKEFFGVTNPSILDIPGINDAIEQYAGEASLPTVDELRMQFAH